MIRKKVIPFFLSTLCIVLAIFIVGCGGSGGNGESDPGPTELVNVSGYVLDKNGNPVAGAEVTISSTPVTVTTDAEGYFSANVEVGQHEITIKKDSITIYSSIFSCEKDTPLHMDEISTSYDPNGNNTDNDGDGHTTNDCDDTDAEVNPGATEVPYNGKDDDCDSSTLDDDLDEDGFLNDSDCNDSDASVNPHAEEICDDSIDNDCDDIIDCDYLGCDCLTWYQDSDGDGYGNPDISTIAVTQPIGYIQNASDCNDQDQTINPDATEIPDDDIDQDCDGSDPADPYFLTKPVMELDGYNVSKGIVIDINSDGYNDFIGLGFNNIGTWEPQPLSPFINDKNGKFYLASGQLIDNLSAICTAEYGFAKADFNGDGLEDLYIADDGRDDSLNEGAQNILAFQSENGGLINVTSTHLPTMSCWSNDCDVGDIDGDGDIDIFDNNIAPESCTNYKPLYINDGTGHFSISDGEGRIPQIDPPCGMNSNLFDADRDGDLDLLIVACSLWTFDDEEGDLLSVELKNILYLNDGLGYFTEAPQGAFPYHTDYMTDHKVKIADFNGDGWLDAVVVAIEFCWEGLNECEPGTESVSMHLYLNNTDGTFMDASDNIPTFDWEGICYDELQVGDFNGDGWMDYIVNMCGVQEDIFIFINQGDGEANFIRADTNIVSRWGGFWNGFPGDFFNDGDTDLFVLNPLDNKIWIAENLKPYLPATPLQPPGQILLTTPSNGSSTLHTPILSWNHKDGAIKYDVQVCQNPNFETFSSSDLNKSDITGDSVDLRNLTSQPGFSMLNKNSIYYWRVRGINTGGSGQWSDIWSFITDN